MIDRTRRTSLSHDVRRLVTGRMTNDAFDDVYHLDYLEAKDSAVANIAAYCYGLYSSDLLFPIRLRGRHAVDADSKQAAARAVLFLRSDLVYEWPKFSDCHNLWLVSGIGFLVIPGSISLLIVGTLLLFSGELPMAIPFLGFGLLVLTAAFLGQRTSVSIRNSEWDTFTKSGDYEVWPFFRHKDFEDAKKNYHLLAKDSVQCEPLFSNRNQTSR